MSRVQLSRLLKQGYSIFEVFRLLPVRPNESICRKIQCRLAPIPLLLLSPPHKVLWKDCDSVVVSTYMASSLSNPATLHCYMTFCRTKSDNGVVLSFVLVSVVFHIISYRSVSLPPLQAIHHLLPSSYFHNSAHLNPHIRTRSSSRRNFDRKTMDNAEMKDNLIQIIKERDQLRVDLMHAKSAIIELEEQTLEYDRLLSNTLSQLQACKSKPTPTVAPKPSWIGT